MSLMDAEFGIPMAEIVTQIPMIDDVAESIEQMNEGEDLVTPTLKQLAMSSDELAEFEVAAFEWSDSVVRYAI